MAERLIIQDYGLPETPMMRKLREQGQVEMVLRQLTRRCGPLRPDITAQVQQFDSAHLLDLAEAVLDFTSSSDLDQWLISHVPQTTNDN